MIAKNGGVKCTHYQSEHVMTVSFSLSLMMLVTVSFSLSLMMLVLSKDIQHHTILCFFSSQITSHTWSELSTGDCRSPLQSSWEVCLVCMGWHAYLITLDGGLPSKQNVFRIKLLWLLALPNPISDVLCMSLRQDSATVMNDKQWHI